jgi:hypothetical protein
MSLTSVLNVRRPWILVFMTLSVLAVGSCKQVPAEYRQFLNLPLAEKKAMLRSMPIDKQIEYYLAGMSYAHPPLMELGDVIASQGKDALPHLVKRLKDEKSEGRQMNLIYVFDSMNRSYYNLREEKEALALLAEVTRNMKDRRSEGERLYKDIVENRSVDLNKFKEEHPQYFPPDANKN